MTMKSDQDSESEASLQGDNVWCEHSKIHFFKLFIFLSVISNKRSFFIAVFHVKSGRLTFQGLF